MRRQAGVLTVLMILAAGMGFVSNASAEKVRVDIDGDRVKDKVVTGSPSDNTTRVTAKLSSRNGRLTSVDIPGGGATSPFIRVKADVNRGKGAELFVRTGSNQVVDTISVLTVARGGLVNSRNFFVNGNLSDGLAVGIKCGQVAGGPGIRTYYFRLGSKGRWNRYVNSFGWKKGRLVKRGKTTKRKVNLPPSSQTGIGCPKPKAPPKPPPVLGSAGNRYFTGLGTVKPRSFSARQGSGEYFGFSWNGWENARATARGSFTTSPGAARKPMNLAAFDLGQCAGREAYRKLTLKASGQNGITLDIC